MTEMQITQGFVKKLATNIRARYGKEEVRHTEVLELIAEALGRKAGPMMHALKNALTTDETAATAGSLRTLPRVSSPGTVMNLLRAISGSDAEAVGLFASLLEPSDAINKFALAHAERLVIHPDAFEARRYLLDAFMDDLIIVGICAAAMGVDIEPDFNPSKAAFNGSYGDPERGALLSACELPQKMLVWGAKVAVDHGFLSFDGSKAVIARPDMAPADYGYDLDERAKRLGSYPTAEQANRSGSSRRAKKIDSFGAMISQETIAELRKQNGSTPENMEVIAPDDYDIPFFHERVRRIAERLVETVAYPDAEKWTMIHAIAKVHESAVAHFRNDVEAMTGRPVVETRADFMTRQSRSFVWDMISTCRHRQARRGFRNYQPTIDDINQLQFAEEVRKIAVRLLIRQKTFQPCQELWDLDRAEREVRSVAEQVLSEML